jgi:tyrosyl-tRNA synthetase
MNPDEILVHGIHILDNNLSMVRVGKKNYYIVEWT